MALDKKTQSKPVLGYWNTRCIAEPIRLILEYTETEYDDKRYQVSPGPLYDKTCWYREKFNLGLNFPNLPYYIDGDVRLSESWAILRFIASKNNLMPNNEEDVQSCDVLQGVLADFHSDFYLMCYSPNFDELKPKFVEKVTPRLQLFENYLKGKKFLIGEKVSFPDFVFYEALVQHQMLFNDIFTNYHEISRYIFTFGKIMEKTHVSKNLNAIKCYHESDRFKKYPVNNRYAPWSGSKEQMQM